jgi:hypothetical protein
MKISFADLAVSKASYPTSSLNVNNPVQLNEIAQEYYTTKHR